MDPHQMSGFQAPTGPGGRKLHIAHRRTPSELTPLMMEQLAIQQQIDALQQQQQHIAATHQQYVNMGMLSPQQAMAGANPFVQSPIMSPAGVFQFPPQLQQQQLGMSMGNGTAQTPHRRNQSVGMGLGMGMGMGPPPAPSSGASAGFSEFGSQSRENVNPRGGRGGMMAASAHARRHSLALPEAKKAAELAEQKRRTSGFQFPIPGSAGADPPSPTDQNASAVSVQMNQGNNQNTQASRGGNRAATHGRSQSLAIGNPRTSVSNPAGAGFRFPPSVDSTNDQGRRGSNSGHARTGSRNFEGNWRQPSISQEQQVPGLGNFNMNQATGASAGQRSRASISHTPMGSLGNFQFPSQPQLIQLPQGPMLVQQPQLFAGQGLNQMQQLAQLQLLQNAQANGQALAGLQAGQNMQGQNPAQQQQQQQQRKTLFTPYLPQATLPALLSDGQLVAGLLRVNKKNRSDAYVTSTDLDADIFICGSKDRNRALEGDLVAVELLDVDEVWSQKREKEEKKKRKDITDNRSSNTAANDATTGGDSGSNDGGIRRRGSLRQRPTQKKNDDVEVEGQSLLLMEEEEINDEQKPLYAGHVVAVVERVAGQMFSGTLGLLRPSSQATKEKQEAERGGREGNNGRYQQDRQQDRPKIVWFKPTDKRVPLIAIPTEQAPRDFVDRHQEYANRIFVACIKRWPITSLHPFGTLVEQLGEMGDLKVETDALLRDNNFGPDEFSDAVLRSIGHEDWSVEADGEVALQNRRDFRAEETFTVDPNGAKELDDAIHIKTLDDGHVEIGVHVADVAHFIKANSLVDREAKKRGTGVYLMNRAVDMLPSRLSADVCCLLPGHDRYTVSVVFKVDATTGRVLEDETWIGKAIIKSSGKLTYEEVDSVLSTQGDGGLGQDKANQIRTLQEIIDKFRQARFGDRATTTPALRLLYQLDDENVPVEQNIFDSSPAHELLEELSHKTNAFVARFIYDRMGDKAWLRGQSAPNPRRLQTLAERMERIGYDIDTSSSGALQSSLFSVEDSAVRMGMETLLIKAMQRAKYCVAGRTKPEDLAHYALNVPLYTHFTNPSRRYADIIVHRQVEAILSGDASTFQEDVDSLTKTAELCNTKKDSAQSAQEQSVHIELCRKIDRERQEFGSDLICEGLVICVYDSAFDIVIPQYGIEKRVHCDQLPLHKAEFDKNERVLELYWEKGVPSSAYVPEDERSRPSTGRGAGSRHYDMDDDDDVSRMNGAFAAASLGSDRKDIANGIPESKITDKKKYLSWLKLRETGGNYIQDVTEMTRVPVILKTDLTKSPPCLTIRAMNPFAV